MEAEMMDLEKSFFIYFYWLISLFDILLLFFYLNSCIVLIILPVPAEWTYFFSLYILTTLDSTPFIKSHALSRYIGMGLKTFGNEEAKKWIYVW